MVCIAGMSGASPPSRKTPDMGRLLAALIAESGVRTPATPATPLLVEPESSRVANVATGHFCQTDRLLSALRAQELPDAFLGFDRGDDGFLAELDESALRAYVRVLRDSDLRERGQRPDDETAAILCARCGPVFAAPEVAAVLPVIAGLPTAAGCAWCGNRKRALPIPRPPMTCGSCAHFERDTLNPFGGIGRCTVARAQLPSEPPCYPFAKRTCADWRPSSLHSKELERTP